MTGDQERHLRMCKAVSDMIESEGYKVAMASLKMQKQDAWSSTDTSEAKRRDDLYLELRGLNMINMQLLRLANEYRNIELNRKAQKEKENYDGR